MNHSRTLSACAAFAFFAVAGWVGSAQAGALDDIKARGSVVCGTEGTYPRFSLQNPVTRKVEGWEPALCAKIAETLGVDIEYKLVTTESRIPELLQGRIDLLAAGISYTAKRAEQIDYSATYFSQPFSIMVRSDSGYKDFASLEKARFANVKGSLLETLTREQFPQATGISFDDVNQQFLALQQGTADAMAVGLYYLRPFQIKGGEDKYTILKEELGRAKVGFAVRKGDPEWVAYLNKVLDDLEASGEGQKIYDTYFGDLGIERSYKFGDPIN